MQGVGHPLAGCPAVLAFALRSDAAPSMLSIGLLWSELNVRASTELGMVGNGIGQELRNSMDLAEFPRLVSQWRRRRFGRYERALQRIPAREAPAGSAP